MKRNSLEKSSNMMIGQLEEVLTPVETPIRKFRYKLRPEEEME